MNQDYEKLFSYLEVPELPVGLFDNVINQIQAKRKSAAKKRLLIFSASTILSVVALFFTFQATRASLVESGFWHFFSLLFSDFKIVVAYGKNFISTLLETLPVTNIIIFLAVAVVFLESVKFLVRNIKDIKNIKTINFLSLSSS